MSRVGVVRASFNIVVVVLALLSGSSRGLAKTVTALTSRQQAAINRYVTAEMARGRIPGLELEIYRDGQPVLEKGYGLADVEWAAKVTPDTLMQSGSVGKQFTAIAVMMLVQAGDVGLDDSIVKYFPDAPES